MPGEVACSTFKNNPAELEDDFKISSPFNFQHIASGAAAAVSAAAAAVGVGVEEEEEEAGQGSHYKEIENKVMREVTGLNDLTEKDLEEWRDRC